MRPFRPCSAAAASLLLASLLALAGPVPASGQDRARAKAEVLRHATALEGQMADMAMELWKYSEIALAETRSAAYLADVLEREGFRVTRGVAGMPTAFVAEWGSGAPVVGVLAEYDALPSIGNEAVPRREARADGTLHGQGCGHNLFGSASVAAAIALKRTLDAQRIPGTVRLFGTPAEETLVGKVFMARDGLFDGLDGVVEWHPGQATEMNNNPGLAMNSFTVEFRGQAAHSAADPWNGRSALDAVELMNDGVNLMREHVRPTARIHYVIPNAGEAPNVVPEYAKAWYYVRDTARASVESYYAWIQDIAKGAALATRTETTVTLITGAHEYNLNRPLQEAMWANLQTVGAPRFTAEEQTFARQLQESLGTKTTGLADTLRPLAAVPQPPSGGSTDVAEVSWIAPTVGVSVVTAPEHVPWHSWATTAFHGTPGAVRGTWVAAKVMALTGVDLFIDAGLRRRAREAFLAKTGGEPYRSPLPPDARPPLPGR
ncbi:MAG TPA: amidohydrolase [Longimicrobiales bacterium]|nr:amidohydrolase [Longimicrobiales bacterium]